MSKYDPIDELVEKTRSLHGLTLSEFGADHPMPAINQLGIGVNQNSAANQLLISVLTMAVTEIVKLDIRVGDLESRVSELERRRY